MRSAQVVIPRLPQNRRCIDLSSYKLLRCSRVTGNLGVIPRVSKAGEIDLSDRYSSMSRVRYPCVPDATFALA
jgi:hypothetical protein